MQFIENLYTYTYTWKHPTPAEWEEAELPLKYSSFLKV